MAVVAPQRLRAPHLAGDVAAFCAWVIVAFFGSMLLWTAVSMTLFGWRPVVVVSDSMHPAVRRGDVVLVDPHAPPARGAVITFDRDGTSVMHRVVGTDGERFVTKGDANARADQDRVDPAAVTGRARLLLPYVGMPRTWGGGWVAAAALPVLVGLLMWQRRSGTALGLIVCGVVVAVLATAAAVFAGTTRTEASSFTAVQLAAPTNLTAACGLIGGGNVDINLSWTASPSPRVTGYRVLYDAPSAGTTFVAFATTGAGQTTATHTISPALLGLGTFTYKVQALSGSWTSPDSGTDAVLLTQVVTLYVCAPL
jgi:signal peptidase I